MPVFNEARTLRTIIHRVLNNPTGMPLELVCVDDCSSDESSQILREISEQDSRVKFVQHATNKGKGAAIRTAIEKVTGHIVLIQDADLEYEPADYPTLVRPIIDGVADVVFGSRFSLAGSRNVRSYSHALVNRFLTWCANVLNDLNLSDMETCFKVMRADIIKQIPLKSNRFGIEPELTTRFAQWNLRIFEVSISYHGRSYAEGKNIGVRDLFDAIWSLIYYRFIDKRFTAHSEYYFLDSIRRSKGFNRWLFSHLKGYLGRCVVEAKCGIGTITEQLLQCRQLVCLDSDPFFVEMIGHRFGHLENLKVLRGSLANESIASGLPGERPDTIILVNALQNLENDQHVLTRCNSLLVNEGHCLIVVPAHAWLFGECDRTLGHHRRYSRNRLSSMIRRAGLEIVQLREFNRLGAIGWLANNLVRKRNLSPYQMRIFELVMPIAKIVDWIGIGPGLSYIAIAKKRSRK